MWYPISSYNNQKNSLIKTQQTSHKWPKTKFETAQMTNQPMLCFVTDFGFVIIKLERGDSGMAIRFVSVSIKICHRRKYENLAIRLVSLIINPSRLSGMDSRVRLFNTGKWLSHLIYLLAHSTVQEDKARCEFYTTNWSTKKSVSIIIESVQMTSFLVMR